MPYGHFFLTNGNTTLLETISQLFIPLIEFFKRFGEYGLFIYSILETITPMAGVEFILFPLLVANADRWWMIALNVVVANTIGAFIVYFFMAKEDNKLYNKVVSKRNQARGKKLFDRYGFWAIFIFAMTPLPFFVILFTAAVAKMKFIPYIFAAFLSRGTRFFITAYAVVSLEGQARQANIILWLAVVGVGGALVLMFIQSKVLSYFENKANTPEEEKVEDTYEQPRNES